jgi:hypothetical protein
MVWQLQHGIVPSNLAEGVSMYVSDSKTVANLLRDAADAHHEYEQATGKADVDWSTWDANWIANKIEGERIASDLEFIYQQNLAAQRGEL